MAEGPHPEQRPSAPGIPERPSGEPASGPTATPARDAGLARLRVAITTSCAYRTERRSLLARATEAIDGAAWPRADSDEQRAELEAAVAAHVRALRAVGLPVEQVVVHLKHVVRDATSGLLDVLEARDLLDDVVRRSIEIYYGS